MFSINYCFAISPMLNRSMTQDYRNQFSNSYFTRAKLNLIYNYMLTKSNILKIVKFLIWIAGLYASIFISMEKIYFIVSCLYFIFTNLGKRKQGELSAYSVFNKNFEKLPGTFSADQLLTGRTSSTNDQKSEIMNEQEHEKAKIVDEYYKNQSKFGNKACFCGSTLKFKKCCLMKERLKQKQKIK